ncbi:hypothetical protein FX016_24175 [Cupriavidus gilardii]|nr:hypothetical protein FX016_24175 [Cupriavidus gilardii]
MLLGKRQAASRRQCVSNKITQNNDDGTAFPFAMLGLGLLGYHELGPGLTRWIAVDLVWATLGGLGIGAALGLLASKTILALRMRFHEAVGLESHFTLGLIGVAYGAALLASTYGFLAVFAAGVAMRQVEREENPNRSPEEVLGALPAKGLEQIATHENKAAAYLTQTVSEFSFDVERLAELCVTLLIGTMLTQATFSVPALGTALLLILLIRPLSVYLSTIGMRLRPAQRRLTAWFGIRGIGSLYYLAYSLAHAPDMAHADLLLQITLCTVVVSIVLHGSTATPRWQGTSGSGSDRPAVGAWRACRVASTPTTGGPRRGRRAIGRPVAPLARISVRPALPPTDSLRARSDQRRKLSGVPTLWPSRNEKDRIALCLRSAFHVMQPGQCLRRIGVRPAWRLARPAKGRPSDSFRSASRRPRCRTGSWQ